MTNFTSIHARRSSFSYCRGGGCCGAALLLAVLVGCGGGPEKPDLYEVTGTVTLDGDPVNGAVITFLSDQRGWISLGGTDETGKYRMLYQDDYFGAAPGTHQVTITTGMLEGGAPGTPIPPRYDHRETSGLTANVSPDGPNEIDFKLTTEPE